MSDRFDRKAREIVFGALDQPPSSTPTISERWLVASIAAALGVEHIRACRAVCGWCRQNQRAFRPGPYWDYWHHGTVDIANGAVLDPYTCDAAALHVDREREA